jgi:protein TonB
MTPAAEAPAPPRSPLVMYGLIAVGVITVALVGFVVLGGWPSGPAPRRDAGESVQVPVAAPDVERSPAVRSDRANVPAAPASSGPVSTVPAPAAAPAARPPAPPRASPRPPAPIGGAITPPTKVKDVPPVYPPIAQSARVQGVVMLEVIIGPSGKVTEVKVIRGIPLLDQAAIDAVSQWEYTPTLLAGVAVPVVTTVTVNFALR